MQQSAERFVTLMIDVLEKGIENIPPYVTDLLFRYSMLNAAYVLIGLCLFVLAGVLRKQSGKISLSDDRVAGYAFGIFFCILIGILFIALNLQDVFIPELGIISLLKREI